MPTKAERAAILDEWNGAVGGRAPAEAKGKPASKPSATKRKKGGIPPPKPDLRRADRLDQAGGSGLDAMARYGWIRQ